MNDRNEWKSEKCDKCTNITQLETTRIIMAIVLDVVRKAVLRNSGPIDFCWTECTIDADIPVRS